MMLFKKACHLFVFSFCLLSSTCMIAQTADQSPSVAFESNQALLYRLFNHSLEEMQRFEPEFATFIGLTNAYNDAWTDYSEEGYRQRYQADLDNLKRLHDIDRTSLLPEDQLNYDLFKKRTIESIKDYQLNLRFFAVDQMGGGPLDVESLLMAMPRETLQDYENILSRLSKIPTVIDQIIALLNKGLASQLTQPQVTLRDLPQTLVNMTAPTPENSIFFQPFVAAFPESIDATEQLKIKEKAKQLIHDTVYPSYRKCHDYIKMTYIPNCRSTTGWKDLPNGEELYAYCVQKMTTTTLTPQKIHAIGLAEVERIEKEMAKVVADSHFDGSVSDFMEHLEHSPEFYYKDGASLVAGYREITHFIDGQLPRLFGHLPKLPYEVVPVPPYSEETQVSAYYMRGSIATQRPGRFYVNTYDIGSRPKWQMESLALHEAVPGHHFQISISQENDALPIFRQYGRYTAYVEGWGLYSEGLGYELGLYTEASSQFGRLIEEIWRAARLVVDSGMHQLGWSREQAIAYMMEKTGMGEREMTTEVDRYLVWPGQALAYKVGELSILKWRAEAEQELGDTFDIRDFHDMILKIGPLPLDSCEALVHAWIEKQKAVAGK